MLRFSIYTACQSQEGQWPIGYYRDTSPPVVMLTKRQHNAMLVDGAQPTSRIPGGIVPICKYNNTMLLISHQ